MLEPSVIMMRIPPTVMLVGVPEAHRWVLIASIAAAGVIWNLCVGYSLVFKGRSIIAKFCSWHSSAYLSLCLTVLSTACRMSSDSGAVHTRLAWHYPPLSGYIIMSLDIWEILLPGENSRKLYLVRFRHVRDR
jgi:hypothetical protein